MTTTISLATREGIVIGCDSLATTIVPSINPYELMFKFFDYKSKNMELKLDSDGQPLLKSAKDFMKFKEEIPRDQIPTVTKLFPLVPAKAGVLMAGSIVIGDKSIKNMIEEFLDSKKTKTYLRGSYTIKGISDRLKAFIQIEYEKEYPDSHRFRPTIELLVSGFSTRHRQPEVFRITFCEKIKVEPENSRGNYNIVFGGQKDVIQRVVVGIYENDYYTVMLSFIKKMEEYHNILQDILKTKKIKFDLPEPKNFSNLYDIKQSIFQGLSSQYSNFSEQAAIDFVYFLVELMIKSQQFSNRLPTVGGEIHIALITKQNGFKWISKESYLLPNHEVPKHDTKPV